MSTKARTMALLFGLATATALGIGVMTTLRRRSAADSANPQSREPRNRTEMRQLSSLDTQYLALENSRQTGHFAGLSICDPDPQNRTPTAASVTELLRERIHLVPPLRWRLVQVPLGLDYPYLVSEDSVDLSYHVRAATLPAPGDDHQLCALVSRLHSRPLDRTRPLWEMYVISGLSHGRVALYTKIHHAVADGVSGTEIFGMLLDADPRRRPVDPPDSSDTQGCRSAQPSRSELWSRGLAGASRHPVRMAHSLPRALPNLEETSLAGVPGAAQLGRLAARCGALWRGTANGDANTVLPHVMKAPKTSFSTKISPHRQFAFGQLDLNRVKQVKQAYDMTVNDVVVSVCAGAVRRWLLDHDELPDGPLIAQVPMSVRGSEHAGTYGNHIQTQTVALHTEIADPLIRLRETAASLRTMKERSRTLPADLLSATNHLVPPPFAVHAIRTTFALATSAVGRPTWNLVVSNVAGPQIPLYFDGAPLVAHYPLSLVTDGMGLNITAMSYDGRLGFGIVADSEQIPDLWTLIDGLEISLSELENAEHSVA